MEGLVTCGVALISFITLTDRPEKARWLSQEEKALAVARVKSERGGQTQVPDQINLTKTLRGIFTGKTDSRLSILIITSPLVPIGYAIFLGTGNPHARYGATFLLTTSAAGSLCMAAVSANVVSDTARASAVATLSAIGNIGAVVATWSFLPFDAPDYKIGNGLNLATSSLMFVLSLLLHVWMMKDNKRRESRDGSQDLEGLSETDVMDLDWKHPRFRWHP
ncbi:hypothetical protein AAF712_013265 [Marasmius tenuissimus]|uniref:Uncharacterized protein n=1 Tax=Marasmius tenuissimus TaxID=585030 RepID=A0ABR2ZG87_9AGAR